MIDNFMLNSQRPLVLKHTTSIREIDLVFLKKLITIKKTIIDNILCPV